MDKKLHHKEKIEYLNKIKQLNICFLITSGRSGSIFLHSLLDSHPEILTFPILFDSYAFWLENHNLNDRDLFIEKLIKSTNFSLLFERKKTKESGDFSASSIDIESFKIHLLNFIPETPQKPDDFFYCIYLAYALSRNINLEKITIIVEHSHFYPYRVSQKRELFPHSLFLHIIRNPKDSFYSYYKRYIQLNNGAILPEHWLYILESCVYGINDILKYDSESFYKTILLENLHTSPQNEMKKLAEFLKVSIGPSLFESTLDGVPYIANSGVHQNTSGFSPEIIKSKYHSEFSTNDISFIESITQHVMRLKNYQFESEQLMSINSLIKYRFKSEKSMNHWGALFYQYPDDISDVAQKSDFHKFLDQIMLLRYIVYFKVYLKYLKSIRHFWSKRTQILIDALAGKD